MCPEAAVSEASNIGDQLRVARERMGLGLAQAAERLHMDKATIESLETGHFAALGAPVFVRGHLRRYAELLGEPDGPLQAQYAALQEASVPPDLTAVPHLPAQPRGRISSGWKLIVVAAVLLIAVVIWWAMRVDVT
jgi:cytoskeleton protein RodZ